MKPVIWKHRVVEDLHNIETHARVWRELIENAYNKSKFSDDKSYWQHELKAFDELVENYQKIKNSDKKENKPLKSMYPPKFDPNQ